MTNLFVFDNYEISGCWKIGDGADPVIETCDDADAQFWTLYGHIDGQGVEAIGDFSTRAAAEQVYCHITGKPFAGSYQASPRLRLMHAAPKLLAALEDLMRQFIGVGIAAESRDDPEFDFGQWAGTEGLYFAKARAALTEATASCPPWVADDLDIHALLARRQQIADVWSIEDVQEVRPDLTAEQVWQVLQQTERSHDANIGINWEVLDSHASILFGNAPESDDEEA